MSAGLPAASLHTHDAVIVGLGLGSYRNDTLLAWIRACTSDMRSYSDEVCRLVSAILHLSVCFGGYAQNVQQ